MKSIPPRIRKCFIDYSDELLQGYKRVKGIEGMDHAASRITIEMRSGDEDNICQTRAPDRNSVESQFEIQGSQLPS